MAQKRSLSIDHDGIALSEIKISRLEDFSSVFTIDSVSSFKNSFIAIDDEIISGHYFQGTSWIKIDLLSVQNQDLILALESPFLAGLNLYELEHGSNKELTKWVDTYSSARYPYYRLAFKANEKKEIVIRINNQGNSWILPITLANRPDYLFKESQITNLFYLYYGAMIVLILLAIMLYAVVRSTGIAYFIGYLTANNLLLFVFDGLFFKYIINENAVLNTSCITFFIGMTCLLNLKFVEFHFKTKRYHSYHKLISTSVYALLLICIAAFIPKANYYLLLANNFVSLFVMFLIVYGLIFLFKRNENQRKSFLLAYCFIMLGALTTIGWKNGLIESSFIREFGFKIGVVVYLAIFIYSLIMFHVTKYKLQRDKELHESTKLERAKYDLLSRQMDPHFIFNALNSIQGLISESRNKEAQNYLVKFSRIVRMTLNQSAENFVAFEDEIELLEKYIEIEAMRFPDKFEYTTHITQALQDSEVEIPPMVTQPFVENAIQHGFSAKEGKGKLELLYDLKEDFIHCTIRDNGIGRELSREAKIHGERSKGVQLATDRIKIINPKAEIQIIDLKDENNEVLGTEVNLKIPIKTY